jgi:hypothetical protein
MNTLKCLRNSIKNDETSVKCLIKLHDGGNVATTVEVVGSTPDSDETLVLEPILVALLHQLVGTADQL